VIRVRVGQALGLVHLAFDGADVGRFEGMCDGQAGFRLARVCIWGGRENILVNLVIVIEPGVAFT
jgi:hypothetical protein